MLEKVMATTPPKPKKNVHSSELVGKKKLKYLRHISKNQDQHPTILLSKPLHMQLIN